MQIFLASSDIEGEREAKDSVTWELEGQNYQKVLQVVIERPPTSKFY